MVTVVLGLSCVVLALAIPVAFYAGLRASDKGLERFSIFARDALETVKAQSLGEKQQVDSARAKEAALEAALKAERELEIEATKLANGKKTKVKVGNLEPLSPDELRDLEQLS